VFANRRWNQAALLLNLCGTLLLFWSFQATSSDFKLVTSKTAGEQYALCVNDYTVISSDGMNGIHLGHRGCPNWEGAKPAAVVNIEHPFFEGLGFVLLLAGFLLQFFSIPQPETVAHFRQQLKIAKMRDRQRTGNPT